VPDDHRGIDQELARLAAATSDLKADDGFTDAVLRAAAEADPLARIARATKDLEPDEAFTGAILDAVRAAPKPARPAFGEGIVRSGRAAIAVAALAAAASVLLFFQTQRQVDEAIMASVDTVEVSE
jgi:hypothetical protein